MQRDRIDLKRRKPARSSKDLVLVVHSQEVEAEYLRWVLRELGTYPARLLAVEEPGPSLLDLVSAALEAKRSEAKKGSPFDEVWCVVDGPLVVADEEAATRARRFDIKIARSNPSFDLWLLLHFTDHELPTEPAELREVLEQFRDGVLNLRGLYDAAARRAADLRQLHLGRGTQEGNPTTNIDELVGSLLESMRKFTGEVATRKL
ncbi:RloB domain-containing protein [Agreia pratensis]|uniref:RloB family protein n=1 Tax=Agreia pratensis TaxID=150121 RepID=UPI00188CE228|nr:RloB family protein [Agreia pratensis]MBF4636215.1 RloB domain-containing protein [Agreia pratensis]